MQDDLFATNIAMRFINRRLRLSGGYTLINTLLPVFALGVLETSVFSFLTHKLWGIRNRRLCQLMPASGFMSVKAVEFCLNQKKGVAAYFVSIGRYRVHRCNLKLQIIVSF